MLIYRKLVFWLESPKMSFLDWLEGLGSYGRLRVEGILHSFTFALLKRGAQYLGKCQSEENGRSETVLARRIVNVKQSQRGELQNWIAL